MAGCNGWEGVELFAETGTDLLLGKEELSELIPEGKMNC